MSNSKIQLKGFGQYTIDNFKVGDNVVYHSFPSSDTSVEDVDCKKGVVKGFEHGRVLVLIDGWEEAVYLSVDELVNLDWDGVKEKAVVPSLSHLTIIAEDFGGDLAMAFLDGCWSFELIGESVFVAPSGYKCKDREFVANVGGVVVDYQKGFAYKLKVVEFYGWRSSVLMSAVDDVNNKQNFGFNEMGKRLAKIMEFCLRWGLDFGLRYERGRWLFVFNRSSFSETTRMAIEHFEELCKVDERFDDKLHEMTFAVAEINKGGGVTFWDSFMDVVLRWCQAKDEEFMKK